MSNSFILCNKRFFKDLIEALKRFKYKQLLRQSRKTESSVFFPKNFSLKKGLVYQCWTGKLKNTISRGTDVETKWFLLTKKGIVTWKSDKYHQKNWGIFQKKSKIYFFLFSIHCTINLIANLSKSLFELFLKTFLFFILVTQFLLCCLLEDSFAISSNLSSKFVSLLKEI